jgi:menaquinone-dependent protoporphyrinogen IX oxidase
MRNAVVVYKSAYGTSKAYAEHIASALNADLLPANKARLRALQAYKVIVFGGGIYAGRIAGAGPLGKLLKRLPGKRLAVFSVGFTPEARLDILEKVRANSFGDTLRHAIAFYHFPGPVPLDRLNLPHRVLLVGRKLSMIIKGAPKRAEQAKGAPGSAGKTLPLDLTKPLIAFVEGL